MGDDANRGDDEAAAPTYRRNEAGLARTDALEPAAPDRRRGSEKHEEKRVHPAEVADLPVAAGGEQGGDQRHVGRAGDGFVEADRVRERQPEHAEAISHPDAEMDGERRRRHEPTIEPGFRDDPLAIEHAPLRPDAIARRPYGGHRPFPPACSPPCGRLAAGATVRCLSRNDKTDIVFPPVTPGFLIPFPPP